MKTIGIIGGGAAGMMAAASILEYRDKCKVVLFDGNKRLGEKVRISGGGRCNVTTGVEDPREVLKKYPRGSKFLSFAMYEFLPMAVRTWFEDRGVLLKKEADLRVFPFSDNGDDVVGVFERLFADKQVDVRLRSKVIEVRKHAQGFEVHTDAGTTVVDALILATGGRAFRHTGSSGDGYTFAEGLGHTLTKLAPSLGSFLCEEQWPKEVSGISFPYVRLHVDGLAKSYDAEGPVLFTHRGITGPAVFTLCSLSAFETCSKERPLVVKLALLPQYNLERLFEEILTSATGSKKELHTILSAWLPKSFALMLLRDVCGVDPKMVGAEASHKLMRTIVSHILQLKVTVYGKGAGDEFVTAGGVSLEEVDQKTMESKITPGLYFAGEILNIDGFTGGYNLQGSWATGRLAGRSASE